MGKIHWKALGIALLLAAPLVFSVFYLGRFVNV